MRMESTEKINALKELRTLRQAEVISEEEFNRERKQIFGSFPFIGSLIAGAIKLLQPIAWPIVALVVLFSLRQPILSKLSEAEQLSVGSFSLKVHERAQMSGNPELANYISGLSQRAIELLMDTGSKLMSAVAKDEKGDPKSLYLNDLAYIELDEKGLLSGPEPYAQFIKWAESLPGNTSILYITGDGHMTRMRPDEPYEVYEYIEFKTGELSEDDKQRLLRAKVTLNDKGMRVWRLIARVVAEQLSAH